MRKNVVKIVVVLALAIILSGLCLVFTACEEEKEPVYEIRLYDDNWVELERLPALPNHYKSSYTYEYDGNIKGFNVKCFVDEEEFYTYDYKNPIPDSNFSPRPINIYYTNEDDSLWSFYPIEKGTYTISYSFDTFKTHANYWTASGRQIAQGDLPSDVYHKIRIIIE